MRLHRLEVRAFGPFAGTVSVDLDELSAGGLFLLTGDTGAGKTSVLDAVCFALYGEVPGDRHTARHLRSDLAEPSAEPRVTLELTVGERRFRFSRSPAWERPKKRGSGLVRVQAHVTVEELRPSSSSVDVAHDGVEEWVLLTHRLDEAGQLVGSLLGMTCTQFTQVAMLPQGRFQAFLRASSAERQAVLQRLFRTERFAAVERWLADHRLALRRTSQTHQAGVASVLSRLEEAAGLAAPDAWDRHDLAGPAEDSTLLGWATGVRESIADDVAATAETLADAVAAQTEAGTALARAREVAALRARALAATATVAELDDTVAEQRTAMARLEAHQRAAGVVPLARRAGAATTRLDEAEAVAAAEVRAMRDLLDPAAQDPSTIDAALTRAAERRAVAQAWLPREHELETSAQQAAVLRAELDELGATLVATREEHAGVLPRLEAVRDTLHAAEREARLLPEREAAVERVEAGARAAAESVALGARLAEQRTALAEVTVQVQDLREEHLDLREARIAGMAAELAGALAVGCSCPVCGSAEHPTPATSSARVTRDDEELARSRHEGAAFEQQALQESVTTLDTQLRAALVASGGHRPKHWRRQLDLARAAQRVSETAQAEADRAREEVAGLEHDDRRLAAVVTTTQVALAERRASLTAAQHHLDELVAERGTLLDPHAGRVTSVGELARRLTSDVAVLTAARAALADAEQAARDREEAVAEALAAAADAGFATAREAVAAHLADAETTRLRDRLDARLRARSAADAVLADPAVAEALQAEDADLEALTRRRDEATAARDRVHAAHEIAIGRARRLGALSADLEAALTAWEPVRRRLAVVTALTALAEGTSAANAWRMRLSAYVLSERLRQVVEAANERLGAMTDQRYLLEQVDERGAGEQRGGLSLRVRDEWSGSQRDPATLSGGETFLVSLALALGLADTVSHEAGGTQLDTLFVDEGFGALDATTLDGVMDTLDSLRDGGRVVGVVSHVPELRSRVTTQLEVRKGRRGSTVHARSGD